MFMIGSKTTCRACIQTVEIQFITIKPQTYKGMDKSQLIQIVHINDLSLVSIEARQWVPSTVQST